MNFFFLGRKKRKTRKMQSKLRQKMDLKMILPNDRVDYGDDAGVFSLNKIRNQQVGSSKYVVMKIFHCWQLD